MRTIDTRGQQCPVPIIATKKALKETKTGEAFKVLADSLTTLNNLTRFLKDNKTEFSVEESAGVWTLTIKKGAGDFVQAEADDYFIPHFSRGEFVVAFTSDKMGTGDDELGNLLMVNFIKAIKELDVLPAKMVFYNRGIMLGKDDSHVIEHLREIEKMGVKLLLCATCVNFYSLAEKIHIGTLSNMYEIAQTMASATNVIKP
ncbi:MAG: sulfurtransferase-like selenium metabolism protein YedF [Bacteroidia bacterium]|nr:sulfurtransferase-like selenium metabolism protein YedF [Bacteroidia bacterium]